jgi:DNA-binding response OmpR family regulator
MAKILIVEDEAKIARFLELELKHEGHEVTIAHDGREGLLKAQEEDVALVLLDVMLPELNGMEVLRRLRMQSEVPVILLTARDQTIDKVMGLDIGADDYITKPFAIEELLARIRVILKRKRSAGGKCDTLVKGDLLVDKKQHLVAFRKDRLELTKREFDLLCYLMENENIVLNRDRLLEKVWGFEYMGDTNVVDVYIRYLRSKIDEKYGVKLIHTVRGVGYLFRHE